MKFKLVSIILIMLLIVTSCSKSAPTPDSTTGEDDGITYPETDVTGVNVTYIKTPSGLVPISICEDGYSTLSSENYYYNLQSKVDNARLLDQKSYTAFTDSGINRGTVDYDDIIQNEVEENDFYTLVTSGNWKLCPNLRKTAYDKDTEADDGFKEYILESYPDNFKSVSDITVTDIWEYDSDADGANEAVVLANGDGYTVLAFLSSTLGNKILAASFTDEADYVAVPFFADLDGNGIYSLVTVWGGGLKTTSVYKENTLEEEYRVYLPL